MLKAKLIYSFDDGEHEWLVRCTRLNIEAYTYIYIVYNLQRRLLVVGNAIIDNDYAGKGNVEIRVLTMCLWRH